VTDALMAEEPEVTIAGQEYQLLPLGLDAAAPLARIVSIAQEKSGVNPADLLLKDAQGQLMLDSDGEPQVDGAAVVRLLTAAIGWAEPEVFLLLSKLLGVAPADLRDPRRFPLSCIPVLVSHLAGTVDVSAFLPGGRTAGSTSQKAASDSPSGA
jgi:hypothetical protein